MGLIQAQILNLMNKLKEEAGASILFITHDLGVIAGMAQNVAVMYAGKVMEEADVDNTFCPAQASLHHPYTQRLFSVIPSLESLEFKDAIRLGGEVPTPINIPVAALFILVVQRLWKCVDMICRF